MAYYGTIVGKRNRIESLKGEMHIYKGGGSLLSDYDGSYEATPTDAIQLFPTQNKRMVYDFKVNATPYSEVSNVYGGYTVTIL